MKMNDLKFGVLVLLLLMAKTTLKAGSGSIDASGRMHFSVNFRFPPTPAEILNLRTQLAIANDFICNATEGQIRFGTVRITAGAENEAEADIWILVETGRSGVSFWSDGSSLGELGAHVDLYRNNVTGDVIAHELGHLAFGMGDEYDEQRRWGGRCGIGHCIDDANMTAQNNCLMQQGMFMTELCTNANHDVLQGNINCTTPTSSMDWAMVLNRADPIRTFDATSYTTAVASSNFREDVEFFDNRGNVDGNLDDANLNDDPRILSLFFVHTSANTWNIRVGMDERNFTGGTAGNLRIVSTITLTFNAGSGVLTAVSPAAPSIALSGLTLGAPNQTITLNVGTIGMANGIREGTGNMVNSIVSAGFPLCGDCVLNWNTTTSRFEKSQQGQSCWQTLINNYGSRVTGLRAPTTLPSATLPGTCGGMNIIEEVTGTDQVMLFIDRSGSMTAKINPDDVNSPTRMDFAKAAARAFVDLRADAAGSSQVGLISFEETPALNRGLNNLVSGTDADGFKNTTINGLVPGGWTGIGTAIQASFFTFDAAATAGRVRTAFLLSDGENNRGVDPIYAAQQLRDRGVRIFTIPVGSAADRSLLAEIAGTSGATMMDAPNGDELPAIYMELAALSKGEGLVLPRTPSAVGGNRKPVRANDNQNFTSQPFNAGLPPVDSFTFEVEVGASKMNAFLSTRNSNISTWSPLVQVTDPNGVVYTNSSTGIVTVDPYYIILKINAPAAGKWVMKIAAGNQFDQYSFVAVHVNNEKPDLYIDAQPRIATPSDVVRISAHASYIANLDETVQYEGQVRRPDNSFVPLLFSYDPQGRAFSAPFNSYNGRGVYQVSVKATSSENTQILPGESIFSGPATPSISLEPFVRATTTAFYLNSPQLPPCNTSDCDHDGIPNDQEGTRDTDGDNIPDFMDDDSDNDDIPDQVEGTSDPDGDGIPSYRDTDSDGDSIHDGDDPDNRVGGNPSTGNEAVAKRRLWLSFHVGSTHPLGNRLDSLSDANIYAAIDLTYQLRDNLNLKFTGGLLQLTSENTIPVRHPRWYHLSPNLELMFPRAGYDWKIYLAAGPGVYWPKNAGSTLGFNAGIGLRNMAMGQTRLNAGIDYHRIGSKDANQVLTFHLGVLLK